MFHGSFPGTVSPRGKVSIPGLARQEAVTQAFGLSGGPGFQQSAQGLVPVPELPDSCFMIVVDNNGEGGHAWEEADLTQPPPARKLSGGRRGTLEMESGSGGGSAGVGDTKDDQVAWSYALNNYDPGTVLKIERVSAFHWAIIEGGQIGDTGSPAPICVDCDGDGHAETCFERKPNGVWGPVDSDPAPPASPPPTDAERKQCYVDCLAAGGTSAECAAKCGVIVTPDPTGGGAGTGGGGGGLGGGGFGGGP
jgi:hypothetical protein